LAIGRAEPSGGEAVACRERWLRGHRSMVRGTSGAPRHRRSAPLSPLRAAAVGCSTPGKQAAARTERMAGLKHALPAPAVPKDRGGGNRSRWMRCGPVRARRWPAVA